MDQSLINTLTEQIIGFIIDNLMDPVYDIITEKVGNDDLAKEINAAITSHLEEVAKTIPKKAPAATRRSGGSSSSADVLKDANGNDIMCERLTKKGTACRNRSKHIIDDQHLCGMHARSASKEQPDSNAKPTKKAPSVPKTGSSTFAQAIGAGNAFSKHDFDDADIDDINL